jgi:hypothetical protein
VEGELHHRIGREQVGEAVGIADEHQFAATGQNVGGHGGWHAVSSRLAHLIQQAFIEQS